MTTPCAWHTTTTLYGELPRRQLSIAITARLRTDFGPLQKIMKQTCYFSLAYTYRCTILFNFRNTMSTRVRENIAWIDLLRIIACFLVVLSHCCDPFVAHFNADYAR